MHKVLVLFFLGFNIKSCVKSLFGTVSMEMRRNITRGHSCIWFCTGEEQHQEPNAETDHLECSTPPGISTLGSTNLLKYPYVPLYSAGIHFFIKQTKPVLKSAICKYLCLVSVHVPISLRASFIELQAG